MTAILTTSASSEQGLKRERHLRAALRSRKCVAGLVILGLLILLSILAATGALPYGPIAQNPAERLLGPSGSHLLGTDQFGRDVFARTAAGVGTSLQIACVAVGLATIAGTAGGLCAAMYGKAADISIGAITNVLFAFPPLLLALTLAAVLNSGWFTVAVAIAVVYVPIFIRVSRAPALALRHVEYVKAAVSLGQRRSQIVIRHVLPNIAPIIILQIALSLSWAVIIEASLSYLGLGVPPPAASLGSMIYDAQTLMYIAPSTVIAPGAAIALLILAFNLLGDGMRDVLDPRTRAGA